MKTGLGLLGKREPPTRFSSVLGVFLALLLLVGGCNHVTTKEVRGTVTLDGNPLPTGEIEFTPTKGTVGPAAGASIEQGKYRVPAVNQGLKAGGSYDVSIISFVPSEQMVADPNAPNGKRPLLINTIPERYNVQTELEVTISHQDKENVLDFALKSDAS